jgi:plastocyanin
MRRLFFAFAAVAALTALAPAAAAPTATHTVRITRNAFSPVRLAVNLGDRVTWRNDDTITHQVVADNGAFASPILGPGKTYSFTFRNCCSYPYHDALHPRLKGTITVRGPAPSVSVALTPPILRYTDSVSVTVSVSSKRAGETVTIVATETGASPQTAATLMTDANGSAVFTSQPKVRTSYQARWGSRSSQVVAVDVRPRLTLTPYQGRLYARVFGARSFAGKTIYLQRLSIFQQWVTVSRFTLGLRSGKIFKRPRTPGTYHVFMPASEAGTGYTDGWSGTQRVRRR